MSRSTLTEQWLAILLLTSPICFPSGQAATSTTATRGLVTQNSGGSSFNCSQPAPERDALIREAVENKYLVRRVEFVGNARTRDNVLRRMITLQEGDVFTRGKLIGSLDNVSSLKRIIYPVKLSDVILHIDRPDKTIDMTICFREKARPRRATGKTKWL